MCAGCPNPLPLDSPEVKKLLEAALKSYNEKSNRDFYFKVVAVLKATSQVVNGIIYKVDFKIQQTNCSKAVVEKPNEDCTAVEDGELLYCSGSEFQEFSSELQSIIDPLVKCSEQQPLQQQGSCIVDIYISGNSLVTTQQECEVQVEEKAKSPAYKCSACLMPIPPDSPELKEPLEAIMKYLNCSKGVKVTKATKQVLSGIIYRIDFIMQKIYCSKPEFQHPNEDSTAVEDDNLLFCHTLADVKPGKSTVIHLITCTDQPPFQLASRPPGFTPFTRK
ncbi:kininogen-1-like [Python bivittatus]|uniref:Kininogen-1-like n=1 Tax=Python bivittatus TaxID=176946 RepID=A0A9F5IVD5_PYTBI|nr:kininogen-1-like [Python bivittatus]